MGKLPLCWRSFLLSVQTPPRVSAATVPPLEPWQTEACVFCCLLHIHALLNLLTPLDGEERQGTEGTRASGSRRWAWLHLHEPGLPPSLL